MDLGEEACGVITSLLAGSQGSPGLKVDPRDRHTGLIADVLQRENTALVNEVIRNKAFPVVGVNLVDSEVGDCHLSFSICCDAVSSKYTHTLMNIYINMCVFPPREFAPFDSFIRFGHDFKPFT